MIAAFVVHAIAGISAGSFVFASGTARWRSAGVTLLSLSSICSLVAAGMQAGMAVGAVWHLPFALAWLALTVFLARSAHVARFGGTA